MQAPILDLNDECGRDSEPVSPSHPQGGTRPELEKASPSLTPPRHDKILFQAPLGPTRKGRHENVVQSRFVAMYTTPVKSSQRLQQQQQQQQQGTSSLLSEVSCARESGDNDGNENSAPIDVPVTQCEDYDVMYSHHARSFGALEFSSRYLKRIDNPDKEIWDTKERCDEELRTIRDKLHDPEAVKIVDELLECSLGDITSGKFRDVSRKITQFYLDESNKGTLNIAVFSKLLLSIARVNRLVEFVQAGRSSHNTNQKEVEPKKGHPTVVASSPLKTTTSVIEKEETQAILSTPPQNVRDSQMRYHTPITSSSPLRTTPLMTKDDQKIHKAQESAKPSAKGSIIISPPPPLPQLQEQSTQVLQSEASGTTVIPFLTPKRDENDIDADDREVSISMISSSFVTIDSPQVKITPIKSDEKRRSPSMGRATSRKVCCRICEQYIPFEDIDKHTKECSKNNSVYAQMNDIKMKIAKFCGLSSSRRASHGPGVRRIHDILRGFVDKCDLDTIDPAFVASAKGTYSAVVDVVDKSREGSDREKLSASEAEDATAILESLSKFIKLCGNVQGITKSGRSKLSAVTIHDFEFIKSIGKGAFGNVYLSRKKTTGDVYAIKRLNKQQAVLKNQLTHIKAERNILASTNSPFLIRSYFSFQTKDNLYLVMEYAPGGDVYSLLKNLGCLDEDMARTYVAQIVLALGYLHKMNIIHRDLKPDNLLISATGHIKLTDFGLSSYGLINDSEFRETMNPALSKAIPDAGADDEIVPTTPESTLKTPLKLMGTDTSNTNSVVFNNGSTCSRHKRYSVVGTPDYLAPEVILGIGHDKNVDWCYEFLTGIPPFNDDSPEKIFENILKRNIEWPKIPDDISVEAYDFINRLLSIDRTQRLGYGDDDAEEVKQHPFLRDVDWDSLLSEDAAVFVPQLDSQIDTSYFDEDRQGSMGGVLRDLSLSEKSGACADSPSFDVSTPLQSSPATSKTTSASIQSPQSTSFAVPSLNFSPSSSLSSPVSSMHSESKHANEEMSNSASPSKEYDVFSDFSYTNVSNLQSLTLEKTMRKK